MPGRTPFSGTRAEGLSLGENGRAGRRWPIRVGVRKGGEDRQLIRRRLEQGRELQRVRAIGDSIDDDEIRIGRTQSVGDLREAFTLRVGWGWFTNDGVEAISLRGENPDGLRVRGGAGRAEQSEAEPDDKVPNHVQEAGGVEAGAASARIVART